MKEEPKVLLALFVVGTRIYFRRLQQKNAMKTKASQANLQEERAPWDIFLFAETTLVHR